ncbi:MAG: hypothetical protein R3F40_13375 [Candidatus Competibacteraceae bacterium]
MHSSLPGRADSARLAIATLLAMLLHFGLGSGSDCLACAGRAAGRADPDQPVVATGRATRRRTRSSRARSSRTRATCGSGIRRRNRAGSPNRAEQTGIQAGATGATPSGSHDEGR